MMDEATLEKSVFELAVQSISAASGLLEEPPSYGALRVLDMISGLVEILNQHDLSSQRLQKIKQRIDQASEGSMLSDQELTNLLDGLVLESLDLLD